MERHWNEEGGKGRQIERQWNRRGVPCVVGSFQWRGVVGSCQWKGGVGSCLENSNVLPFGPRKIWRGDVGPLVCPVSETKKITAIFCSHCNHIKRSKMAPKSHCSHPKWHENSTKTTSAKTAKNASIDRSLFLLTFRVLCSEIDTTLQMQADNARDFMTIRTDGGFIHAPVP